MGELSIRDLVEEGTLDFTLGDLDAAKEKLGNATDQDPDCFDAWSN